MIDECVRGMTIAAALAMLAAPTQQAHADEFYKGRTIDFIIAGNAGAGYDTYGRTLVRHMGRHIPGAPSFVVRNMPGAGGAVAAAWIANVAPKDGGTFGAIYPGAIMNPLLQPEMKLNYDPTAFNYIGSADASVYVCATFHTSPVKTYADARRVAAIFGASSTGSTSEYAYLHKKAGGAKFNVVTGYKGTGDIMLAMERGEVDGLCGLDWASAKAQRPDWVRDGKLNFLVQDAIEPDPELSKLGVPQSFAFITDPVDRKAVELIVSQQVFGRPYIAPPGMPAARVKVLRDAFLAVMKDERFLADAKKSRLNISPTSGERVEELIEGAFKAPKETVARARELIAP